MGEIIRMIVVLSLITGIAGGALANLKAFTDPRIEKQVLTYVQKPAVESIYTGPDGQKLYDQDPVDSMKKIEVQGREDPIKVFPAIKDGELQAVAFETSAGGYGGDVGVMVGFKPDGETLAGIGITTLKETPGLGMRITEPQYTSQFRNLPVSAAVLSGQGGDIDAVSGATISSAATTNAVQKAKDIFEQIEGEIEQAW
jgi:electron transport complex protein RnfG